MLGWKRYMNASINKRPWPPGAPPGGAGRRLYVDLEARSALRDRLRRRLHHRHRAPRFLRRDGKRLVPREVVREVTVEAVLVARRQGQPFLVRATAVRRA